MRIEPKEPAATKLPMTLEDAVVSLNSKFPFISDSVLAYEEIELQEGTVRAVHTTYHFGAKLENQETINDLIQEWLSEMLNAVRNSKRRRLYWRMKPKMTVEWTDFSDGPAWSVEIISRSAMV